MNGGVRVLCVGESAGRERTAAALDRERAAFDVDAVDDAETALSRLSDDAPDCVVAAYDLPGRDGLDLLTAVREAAPELPFVMFTDVGSEAVAGDAVAAGVTEYLPKDGAVEPYAVLADRVERAVRDRDGAPGDERLRDVEAQLGALYQESPDIINIHDADGRLIDANERFRSRLGYDEAEITELSVWDIAQARTPAEMKAVWREMGPGDRRRLEGGFETATGETFPVEVHVRRLDVEGDPRFVAISRDVTERTERRERLRERNERLEEFASVVSHDLRNPLQVAQGRVELSRSERDDEHLEAADTALDRMDSLIDDLLTLARYGEDSRELRSVDLGAAVRECWCDLESTAETAAEAGATLTVGVDAAVRADGSHLHQLLENLVANAVEHGGPGATVTVGRLDDPPGFYVADDGPGIPEGEHEAVFEAGYSRGDGGTGFGLRIVEQVADAHGWTVTATDGADGGARFEVTDVEFVE